ncbi:SDR family NAD(P)-dependent oxidoreductase [Kaistia geumhonensis]|uniref:NAD(P)-dependent dehydrogenase (Short-subunit alcohol dehydrogenase family) n=1 Tax=Kaistia geumhonensis TaxID=410839 RepID=A0ABU0M5E2_9HYPH|nr:SDR family oxidoreductase [Kaistia geumhonensis]MCX5478630.1 SDR family NAD(P)-dependent oxidoreductase [Kaistia geumhonensis]MDQ0516152.1 NAD(P)-dependent dehydrogenase (short-subunit alcohol dehydrogenase family) [Kaistia geumhonensis]
MSDIATYPSLRNRTVLVTGGGGGIGASIVRHFVAQGSKVGFLDIDETGSRALVAELEGEGTVHFEPCDITDIEALRAAIGRVREHLGPITILINNAAHDERHAIEDVTPDYWDQRLAVNLKHQFFAAQAVMGDMKAAGGGAIVNIGSNSWMQSRGGMPGYTTAKSAIVGLTRSLARDLGPFNIRVCSVVPGWIMTERQVSLYLTPAGVADLMQGQCLKRPLQVEDIARPVLFFASDEASACTNQSYVIDGGWV